MYTKHGLGELVLQKLTPYPLPTMLHIFVALVAAGLTAAAPSPSAPQGCPAGAVGIGGSQLCPESQCPLRPLIVCCADHQRVLLAGSCAGLGLTATLYAAGSCTPVAHSTTIGNSAVCDDTFNNDGGICTYCKVINVCSLTRPSSPLLSVRAPAGLQLYGQLGRRAVHQLRDVQLPELHLL
jgi:hypothetical protein